MSVRGYGALNLGFAALYAWLGFAVAPSRAPAFQLGLGAVAALLALAGLGLLVLGARARGLAIVACGVLLAFTVVLIGLLVASASFLLGVYGALGRGVGVLSLVAAALVVELCGLLPIFQLRFLLRRART